MKDPEEFRETLVAYGQGKVELLEVLLCHQSDIIEQCNTAIKQQKELIIDPLRKEIETLEQKFIFRV